MTPSQRVKELGLELPPPSKPVGLYKPVVICENLAYVSGHGPKKADGTLMTGRVGSEVDLEYGQQAARQCGLSILASLEAALGSLDRVHRVIKSLGMVNCTADFTQQPAVIDGFSALFAQVFGEDNGVGARSAVGMGSLPSNMSVEVETIVELKK